MSLPHPTTRLLKFFGGNSLGDGLFKSSLDKREANLDRREGWDDEDRMVLGRVLDAL